MSPIDYEEAVEYSVVMKKLFIISIVAPLLIIALSSKLYAPRDVACPCDSDGAGNCLPCTEQNLSAPPVKNDESIPEVVCLCDIDAAGNCVPCDGAEDNPAIGDE